MKFLLKHKLAAMLGGLFLAATSADATITFTGGGADLTFYYDSVDNNWAVVLRAKGSTGQPTTASATGLTAPFNSTSTPATWNGIVGNIVPGTPGDTGDYTFNTLQMNVTAAPVVLVNGNTYLVTPASGSSYSTTAQPDLGIRTRLRENFGSGNVDQFASMRLTLDWASSTRPAGAEFTLFNTDINGNIGSVLYDTAADDFSHDWGVYGHDHWHFGFSDAGEYSLEFEAMGIGGEYGTRETATTFTLNFNVIPEPSTAMLSMFAAVALGFRRRRA